MEKKHFRPQIIQKNINVWNNSLFLDLFQAVQKTLTNSPELRQYTGLSGGEESVDLYKVFKSRPERRQEEQLARAHPVRTSLNALSG